MSREDREIEAKFYLSETLSIRDTLVSTGAEIVSERVFERNWRFDTSDRKFESSGEVLRIRKDVSSSLTYKKPTDIPEDRIEINVDVVDGESATRLFSALGFEVVMIYEKYRETFLFQECLVFLDELPFGNFVEVEGDSLETIQRVAGELGLNWDKRVLKNYSQIISDLSQRLSLPIRDATFENFAELETISAEDLGLQTAME